MHMFVGCHVQLADAFKIFFHKLLRVARRYPSAASLVGSMQQRLEEAVAQKGAMAKN